MTTGQRIAQKRREMNLSQEALGEALGVSRQSISKWESDSSLPEIEKLVALSKLFAVRVGWLLGVEEPVGEAGAPPEDGEGRTAGGENDLSGAQLKMVEEIVSRYIAAQPKPKTMSKKKRRALKACGVGVALCLVMGVFWVSNQMERLENQYNSLQNSVGMISDSVDRQIYSIGNRVEEILQAQNSLTADYAANWVERDVAAGTVTLTAYAVPKTYREGMTARFLAECDGEVLEFPAELTENQTFSATFHCPLVDNILVSVVFVDGDTRETQLLQQFDNLYSETIPEVELDDTWCFDDAAVKDGVLEIPANILNYRVRDTSYYGDGNRLTDVSQVKVGLFKNQKLVAWGNPIAKPDNYHGFEGCSFVEFLAQSFPVKQGDILCYALVVTDEYGRTTVRGGEEYTVTGASGEDGDQTLPEVPWEDASGDSPSTQVPNALVTTGQINYYRYDDPADWGLTGY